MQQIPNFIDKTLYPEEPLAIYPFSGFLTLNFVRARSDRPSVIVEYRQENRFVPWAPLRGLPENGDLRGEVEGRKPEHFHWLACTEEVMDDSLRQVVETAKMQKGARFARLPLVKKLGPLRLPVAGSFHIPYIAEPLCHGSRQPVLPPPIYPGIRYYDIQFLKPDDVRKAKGLDVFAITSVLAVSTDLAKRLLDVDPTISLDPIMLDC